MATPDGTEYRFDVRFEETYPAFMAHQAGEVAQCPGRIIPSVTLHGDMMVSPATAGSNRGASHPIQGES